MSYQVALVGRGGAGCDGRLPVALVDKDGPEVAHNVDDPENLQRVGRRVSERL